MSPTENLPDPALQPDENHLIADRRAKLAEWRQSGQAFPNDFARENTAGKINDLYDSKTLEELAAAPVAVRVAGRIMLKRVMGKASFITVQDLSGRIQAYVSRDQVGDETYAAAMKPMQRSSAGTWGTLSVPSARCSAPVRVS